MGRFRPLTWTAAAACLCLLFFVSIAPSLYLVGVWKSAEILPHLVRLFLVGAIFGLGSAILGLPVARFLLRAVPMSLERRLRPGAVIVSLLLSIFCLGSTWLLAEYPVPARQGQDELWYFAGAPEESRWIGMFCALAFVLAAVSPFVARQMRVRNFLNRPFVVFLRRFSTFSDRSVMNELLRACPAGKPVVFLTPRRSATRDWNPFQVGYAGLKVVHPFSSLPAPLVAADDQWQPAARELLTRAETIVLDVSLGSASISQEIEMVRSMGLCRKTVLLAASRDPVSEKQDLSAEMAKEAQIILYRKSWYRALPRLLLGLPASLLAAMVPAVPLTLVMLPLVALFVPASLIRSSADWALYPVFALCALWVYGALFVRPAIDRASAATLAKRLRTPYLGEVHISRKAA